MEDLQQLVSESLIRNGFEIPRPRSTGESASVETRLAASPADDRTGALKPAPLPSGF